MYVCTYKCIIICMYEVYWVSAYSRGHYLNYAEVCTIENAAGCQIPIDEFGK